MADPYGALRELSALDALLGGLMVAVVLYCLARAFVPASVPKATQPREGRPRSPSQAPG